MQCFFLLLRFQAYVRYRKVDEKGHKETISKTMTIDFTISNSSNSSNLCNDEWNYDYETEDAACNTTTQSIGKPIGYND